nr:unnamed protein product [Digitaria exilis]
MRALVAAATPPLRALPLLIHLSPRLPPPIPRPPRFIMNPSSSSSSSFSSSSDGYQSAASPHPRGRGRGGGGGGRRGGRGGRDGRDQIDASGSSSPTGGYHSVTSAFSSLQLSDDAGTQRRGGGGWRGGRGGSERIDAFGSSSFSTSAGYHSSDASGSSSFSTSAGYHSSASDSAPPQPRGGGRGGRGGGGRGERIYAPGSSSSSTSAGYHSTAATFAYPQPRGGGRSGWRGRRGGGRGGRSDGDANDRIAALGRLLSRVLRHMAAELGLDMRTDGYVRVRDLLRLNVRSYVEVPLKSHTVDEIREAVRWDNKGRFSLLEEDGELLIRANQGHSVTLVTSESLLKPILSADEVSVCVHGTYRKYLSSILQSGLKRMARLHVHFSSGLPSHGEVKSGMFCPFLKNISNEYVLVENGIRHDVNILIHLDVRKALHDGMKLYISDNKVILTEGFDGIVPVKYFEKIETWPKRTLVPFEK